MIVLLLNIATWLGFGLVVGIVANILDPHPQEGGLAGAITLGMIGALIGGFVATFILGQQTGLNTTSLSIAVLCALLFLFLQRAFTKSAN